VVGGLRALPRIKRETLAVLTAERLDTILRTLPRLTIGLVGDLFLDRYLELVPGSHESSIETGLEAYQVERVRSSPGALGTVLNNLAALGVGLLVPVTAIGDDGHGYDLLKELRKLPVDLANVLCLPDRLTPTYTKPLRYGADGTWQELNRLDVRTRAPLAAAATAELCQRVEAVFGSSDGLIVLDQLVDEDCGVVNGQVRQTLARLAATTPDKLIFVDSRRFLSEFNFGVLKGNHSEVASTAAGAVGNAFRGVPGGTDDVALRESLIALAHRTGRAAYCTLGERGILVARPGGGAELVATCPASGPIDIVGAGDAATSGIVCGLLAGCSPTEAAELGNLVASITIQQLGTTGTATPAEVRDLWKLASQD
jgi:bifunctional ADP-heptose synthase (sugar kinase/adenylyltransferase)